MKARSSKKIERRREGATLAAQRFPLFSHFSKKKGREQELRKCEGLEKKERPVLLPGRERMSCSCLEISQEANQIQKIQVS